MHRFFQNMHIKIMEYNSWILGVKKKKKIKWETFKNKPTVSSNVINWLDMIYLKK